MWWTNWLSQLRYKKSIVIIIIDIVFVGEYINDIIIKFEIESCIDWKEKLKKELANNKKIIKACLN